MLGRAVVIAPPPGVGTFEFVVLAALRTAQLVRGCSPRVDGCHKKTTTAQMEIAAGRVKGSVFTSAKAATEDALVRVLAMGEPVLRADGARADEGGRDAVRESA